MAALPLRALWIGDKPIEFSDGSWLDTDLQAMTVTSLEVRLPFGVNETVKVRVEVTGGRFYEGQMTTKMPRDTGGRNQAAVHFYEFASMKPLEQSS